MNKTIIDKDFLLLDKQVLSEFECCVCYNLLSDPVKCAVCGLYICKSCAQKLNSCPYKCSSQVLLNSIKRPKATDIPGFDFPDKFFSNIYDFLKIPCKNNNCNEKITIKNYYTHITTDCPYITVKCSNPRCNEVCFSKEVNKHKLLCDKKHICKFCDKEVSYVNKDKHELNCYFENENDSEQRKCKKKHRMTYVVDADVVSSKLGKEYCCSNNVLGEKSKHGKVRWKCSVCKVRYCFNCIPLKNNIHCPFQHFSEEIDYSYKYMMCELCLVYGDEFYFDEICNIAICLQCGNKKDDRDCISNSNKNSNINESNKDNNKKINERNNNQSIIGNKRDMKKEEIIYKESKNSINKSTITDKSIRNNELNKTNNNNNTSINNHNVKENLNSINSNPNAGFSLGNLAKERKQYLKDNDMLD